MGLVVLYVEDNASNVIVVARVADSLGVELRVAPDAISMFASLSQELPALILLDISLPDMDGMTAARMIRQKPSPISDIPIIAVTANAMEGDRERCLEAGCNDYLAKPFRVSELSRLIKHHLNLS
ncbi:MAG: hypothetical protein OHK0023_20600 [Anaerolineae bacterium]